jgi:alkylation response protein AidB-like acyl-CoA dehydrogenase
MPTYKAPLEDIRFILNDVIDAPSLANLPGYTEATEDGVDAVLNAAAQLCEKVLFPLNQSGDVEGCTFKDGAVTTPQGFKEAYQTFRRGGWSGLACKKEYGGQDLPLLVNCAFGEMISSANMAFGTYPALAHAAYNAIEKHASDALKKSYLPKLVDGTWTGTMCMTEPQCGTDLGLIRTKAEPQSDGTYKITGGKIFISAGEHDLSENIIHMVLARLPDALPGVRGISLFLVPKFLPETKARNAVSCGRLEHKMGIHASATCALNFDGATGWLIGAPNKGMSAMFTMVNEARLLVGLQGLGLAEVAYQNAARYAKERLQMRALTGAKFPDKAADPIIVHPDIRLNLMTIKSLTEGCRALAYWVAREIDISTKHPDAQKRAESADFVALMTPIVKAFTTDMAFDSANKAVQIFGGHGYVRDNGIEQYARDVRITQIYEGANGIQALDLVMRKMAVEYGRLLRTFFHPVEDFIAAEKNNGALAEAMPKFMSAFSKLQMASLYISTRGVAQPDEAGVGASDYLHLFALVAVGFMWMKMSKVAATKLLTAGDRVPFYETKLKTADFYFARILPQANSLHRAILSGAKTIMDFPDDAF